jgi:glycosyltransferase involved in cell wall biosynthesis
MAEEFPILVSIIIPAYNAAEYIGETLDSVFAQTFSDYEVIVINDGSPDTEALESVLERYSSKLRYIKQENKGAAAARNAGLRAAAGELVAFLDADDTWLPSFLEKQVSLLKRTGADFVYADALLVGESAYSGRTFMQLHPSRGEVTAERLLGLKVTILTSTVLARRVPIMKAGLFEESLRRGQDFELWLRLAKLGIRFSYQREVLARHLIVESGLSGDMTSQLQRSLAVLEAIKTRTSLTARENAALQANMEGSLRSLALEKGKEQLLDEDYAGALRSFTEAKKFRGSLKLILVCLGLRVAPKTLARLYNRRNGAAIGSSG